MKRKTGEVTVFSMSALDLFAGALGAFILLAVILFPFFPNTGDSPIRVAELQLQLEAMNEELDSLKAQQDELNERLAAAESRAAAAERELEAMRNSPKVQFPPLDLVIALDTTGSMQNEVEGLKSEIAQLSELLMAMAPSVGIGVVDFKDRCEVPTVRTFDLAVMDSTSLGQLQSFANSMAAGGDDCNRDGPEAVGAALSSAIAMRWRPESKVKVIVVITDNPAYDDEFNSSLAAARSFVSRGGGHQVSAVSVRGGGAEYLRSLAEAGQGKFVSGGGSFATTLLLALAGT